MSEKSGVKTVAFQILVFLEKVPKYLKEGPWSPVAHVVLIVFFGYILLSYQNAVVSYNQSLDVHIIHNLKTKDPQSGVDWIQYYRLFGGLYMLMITSIVVYTSGFIPLCSYTVTRYVFTCTHVHEGIM